MTARSNQMLSTVLILVAISVAGLFGQTANATPMPFGEAADGTRIMFDSRLPHDYKKASKHIDDFFVDRPATAQDYVKRMKANCSRRFKGHGAFGMLAALGPELVEETAQEIAGDSLGFSVAQVAAGPQDDPAWFIHWAESTISTDMLQQIGIAVVTQIFVERQLQGVTNDVCAYYLAKSPNKVPLPTVGIEDGSVTRQLSQMTPDEALIAKRIYKNVRLRRAAVSGGGMALGMVLGQNYMEAKNDVNLRKCVVSKFAKRWGSVSEFAEASDACHTAARTWFSKAKAADLSASVLSALMSGGVTYGIRESMGAALHASGMMDRSRVLKYLSSNQARLFAHRKLFRGGKSAIYTIRGLRMAAATTGVGFMVEVALEAGTSLVIYYVDQNIVRPIVIPYFKGWMYDHELSTDTQDITVSLNNALSGKQNWKQKLVIAGGGTVPMSQTVDSNLKSVEELLSDLQFKTSQWRDHALQDVNEIRSNWMDAVKYPDAVMNQAKIYYETLIDLGGHDALYPTPLNWDFFTNPNTRYKTPLARAMSALTANTDASKKQLDSLVYELDTAYNYIGQLSSPDGRRKLLEDKLVSSQFIKRVETPEVQAALKADALKVQAAGLSLMAAQSGQDIAKNVEVAITSMVKMVNDPNSIFGFPALYRAGNQKDSGGTSAKWATSLRQNLDIGEKYGYFDGSDSCGEVTKSKQRAVKKVDRYPAPETSAGKLQARFRCNNQDRYAFVQGVYQNRIYMALKTYVGFPFKLQPKVEDVEQILNVLSSGELFQQNNLEVLSQENPYGTSTPLFSGGSKLFGFMPIGAGKESAAKVRLYSNLDLFTNRLLCGNWLDSEFLGDNDVPVIDALKKEGLRVKMGAPRITVELDGKSVPFVCNLGTGMAYKKYVDYYSKDFMFLNRANVAPMRTALSYTGQMTGNFAPGESNTIPRQYTDFLDLAMRRIHPMFLKSPEKFEKLWADRIEKPYAGLSTDRGLQGRYEKLMKQTMVNQGIVWRRKGDFSKCDYKNGLFADCKTSNVYDANAFMEPRAGALTAFQHDEPQTPDWKKFNSSISKGLTTYAKTELESPLSKMADQSGRGLYATTAAEVGLYSKVMWKVTKNVQDRLSKAGVNSLPKVAQIAVILRRLARANELTWQMIDEHTPTHPKACSADQLAKGCSASRVAAYGIVEAMLPMLGSQMQRQTFRMLEVEFKNARLLPEVKPTDNRLVSKLSNKNDESIDQVMERFASDLKSSPENRLGSLRAKMPDVAWKFSRTDAFFRTAKTFALMSVELDLFNAVKAATNMIWMTKKTSKGEVYILSTEDRLVLTSIVFESAKGMRSTFQSIHGQVALFDAFKQGSGDPKVNEAYGPIEDLAHKMQDITSSAFDYFTETSCQHRGMLDSIYKSRPDVNRSVSCAVQSGKLSLDNMAAIKRFENVVP